MAETHRTPGHNEPDKRKKKLEWRPGCLGVFFPLPISKGDLGFLARRSPLSTSDEAVLNDVSNILNTAAFTPFIKYLYCRRIVNAYFDESAVAREFDIILSSGAVDRDEGIAKLQKILRGEDLKNPILLPLTDDIRKRMKLYKKAQN